jgi:hypothetical protein
MLADEALTFVRDVLDHARADDYNPPTPFFPFNEASVRAIIDDVGRKRELRPRVIMNGFNAVLQEADTKLERGEMDVISPEFARTTLSQYVTLDSDSDEEG